MQNKRRNEHNSIRIYLIPEYLCKNKKCILKGKTKDAIKVILIRIYLIPECQFVKIKNVQFTTCYHVCRLLSILCDEKHWILIDKSLTNLSA